MGSGENGAALAVVETKHEMQVSEYHRKATDVAGLVRAIVLGKAVKLGSRQYVPVDAYQAIANAMGCVASAHDVQKVDGGYTAKGIVKRLSDGAILAEGEGFVGDDEPKWAKGPEYARRSMVQTRAIGRACRAAFAFVVPMIDLGLSSTPAEEMEGIVDRGEATPPPPKGVAAIKAQVIQGVRPSPVVEVRGTREPEMSEEEKQSIYAQESRETGGPAASPAQRTHEDISFRFGKNKDKPLSKLSVAEVRWYRDAMRRDLADPARNEWRDANTHALACCEAELRFRGQN